MPVNNKLFQNISFPDTHISHNSTHNVSMTLQEKADTYKEQEVTINQVAQPLYPKIYVMEHVLEVIDLQKCSMQPTAPAVREKSCLKCQDRKDRLLKDKEQDAGMGADNEGKHTLEDEACTNGKGHCETARMETRGQELWLD